MALCESPYHSDFGSLADHTTPPFMSTYSISSTPLILPRDWSDNYYFPSASDPRCDNYDFQSNHLETPRLSSGFTTSVSGLGIRNVDLDKDLEMKDLGTYGLDDLQHHQPQDRRHIQGTYRKDAIYDVCKGKTHSDRSESRMEKHNSISNLWPVSSIFKTAELNTNNTASGLESSLSSGHDQGLSALSTGQLSGTIEHSIALSFEKLSAASGLSMAEFAAQISATAEATLKHMAESDKLVYPNFTSGDMDPDQPCGVSNWSHTVNKAQDLALPLVDTNRRVLDPSWDGSCVGINPADILPVSPPTERSIFNLPFLSNASDGSSDSLKNLQSRSLGIGGFDFEMEQSFLLPDPGSPRQGPYTLPLLKVNSLDDQQVSDGGPYGPQSPSSSNYSPAMRPLNMKRNRSSRIKSRRKTHDKEFDPDISSTEYTNDIDQQDLPPINLGTPVFDAHRGIALEELKGKAERYRLRNQGRDYDKRWLISFAGKLSERGELVEEFRCYVAGCKQVNKRRDHILIHVGAHLGQRPFKCIHCSSRFLRKNECKRHELSHTGIRPFTCHLCPTPATTFVRQDLLKRHMKRTHRLDLKIEKENDELPRPKKKTKY